MQPSFQYCRDSLARGPFARIVVGSRPEEGGADAHALATQLAALCDAELVLADRVDHRLADAGSAARRLRDAAISQDADLIVVGSSDHEPVGHVFSRSVAGRLLSDAHRAIAVAPRGYAAQHARPLNVVLAAVDGSPEARIALRAAHALATRAGAALHVMTVIIPSSPGVPVGKANSSRGLDTVVVTADAEHPAMLPLPEALRCQDAGARATLAAAIGELPGVNRIAQQILLGPDAAFMIIEAARDGTDLLVLGSRGRGPLRRALLGSVSGQVIRRAPCPVLVMPATAGDDTHLPHLNRQALLAPSPLRCGFKQRRRSRQVSEVRPCGRAVMRDRAARARSPSWHRRRVTARSERPRSWARRAGLSAWCRRSSSSSSRVHRCARRRAGGDRGDAIPSRVARQRTAGHS